MTSKRLNGGSANGLIRAQHSSRVLSVPSSRAFSGTSPIPQRYPVAKKTVVEIQCDRCPRREYIDGDAAAQQGPTTVTFQGKTITFSDLCSACHAAVASHVEAIGKKLEGRSPERTAKTSKPAPEGASPPAAEKPPLEVLTRPGPTAGPRPSPTRGGS